MAAEHVERLKLLLNELLWEAGRASDDAVARVTASLESAVQTLRADPSLQQKAAPPRKLRERSRSVGEGQMVAADGSQGPSSLSRESTRRMPPFLAPLEIAPAYKCAAPTLGAPPSPTWKGNPIFMSTVQLGSPPPARCDARDSIKLPSDQPVGTALKGMDMSHAFEKVGLDCTFRVVKNRAK
eukprot:m51a1_g2493 hypothetical protein (183) ;mRNA; f:96635-97251